MEKEEKIAEAHRKAAEMSFFNQLRQFYPIFAVAWVCFIRIFLMKCVEIRSHGCGFIFITQFLEVVNPVGTAIVTLASQTLVNNYIYNDSVWLYSTDTLMFDTFLTILLMIISVAFKTFF